jgi:cell wall-associated NlpC family hydrolase
MGLVRPVIAILLAVLVSRCASSGAVPRPFPGDPNAPGTSEAPSAPSRPREAETPTPAAIAFRNGLAETALSLRGRPYRSGGSDPKGFDCSGLVQYVFSRHGITVPREVREQLRLGREVRLAAIDRGDLIFFAIGSTDASHVGVAVGGDEFVHAPSGKGVVRVEKFSAPYWARRIVAIRRFTN